MTEFDIKLNIKKLSDYSEEIIHKKDKKTLLVMIESFAQHVKDLYLSMIEEAIYSRRYKGKWEPVEDEGYIEYLGVTPTENILYLIKDAMVVKKIGPNFYIMIDPKEKYPGTMIPLIKVLRSIENGTSKFNARPIIKKLRRQINSHILNLWRGYLSMRNSYLKG